ncbi:hypothetical protein BDQ17DRAFT_1421621 [Cyathus striatus]|nr:hypothetical protein BDQ17DRAFT_1421621 [Cyathus striatus]
MPAIVCPQPRSPTLLSPPKLLLSPPPTIHSYASFSLSFHPALSSPPRQQNRLRSPNAFVDSCLRAAPTTPKPLLTPKRRRHKGSHVLRRRRPLSRVDFRFDAPRSPLAIPHIFDSVPWISALESTPERVHPWDIADLSLIPDAPCTPSGPGPVRHTRSKLSTRPSLLNQLRASVECSGSVCDPDGVQRLPPFLLPSPPMSEASPFLSDTTPTATPQLLLPSFSPSSTPAPHLSPLSPRPQTPRSRFDPSRVIFRNLMPIDSQQDGSDCIHNDF